MTNEEFNIIIGQGRIQAEQLKELIKHRAFSDGFYDMKSQELLLAQKELLILNGYGCQFFKEKKIGNSIRYHFVFFGEPLLIEFDGKRYTNSMMGEAAPVSFYVKRGNLKDKLHCHGMKKDLFEKDVRDIFQEDECGNPQLYPGFVIPMYLSDEPGTDGQEKCLHAWYQVAYSLQQMVDEGKSWITERTGFGVPEHVSLPFGGEIMLFEDKPLDLSESVELYTDFF